MKLNYQFKIVKRLFISNLMECIFQDNLIQTDLDSIMHEAFYLIVIGTIVNGIFNFKSEFVQYFSHFYLFMHA